MLLIVVKVLLAPALVACASLAQRRWGPAVGGRIIGLPLTALPLLLLMAVTDGHRFAAAAATANQAGGVAQAGWVLTYALAARRVRPAPALAAATAVFAGLAVAAGVLAPPLLPATVLSAGAVLLGLAVWPAPIGDPEQPRPWRWELPVRMVVAAGFTLVLSGSAARLGAGPAGLVGAFPLLATILAVATHAGNGPAAADRFLRGVLGASWSVVVSLLVLALALPRVPLAAAVGLAAASALAAQSVAARLSGRPSRPSTAAGRRRGASVPPRRDPVRTVPVRLAPAPR